MNSSRSQKENIDRFIPNRSAMDFGYANSMLTEPYRKKVNSSAPITTSTDAYRRALADAANLPTRILAFRN
ncbi:anaphase-promoting complex subunit cdc20-like protein, partial [Trifolium pratense]